MLVKGTPLDDLSLHTVVKLGHELECESLDYFVSYCSWGWTEQPTLRIVVAGMQ
jgi:hypothetical protein